MLWTREEVSLTDSAGIRERERVTEGGSESERLGWHSRFANENDNGGWSESERLVLIRDSRTRTRGGGRKWVWTTHWIIHRKHDWTNERTNERTTLFGELNDANWFAETNHEIHHYERLVWCLIIMIIILMIIHLFAGAFQGPQGRLTKQSGKGTASSVCPWG